MKVKKGRPLVGFPNSDPVVVITAALSPVTVDSVPEAGEYTATAIDVEQGDIASSLVWTTQTSPLGEGFQNVDVGSRSGEDATGLLNDGTPGTDDATNGAEIGTKVTALATAAYDFDVIIDGGGLQQLTISIAGGEDYSTIAGLMSVQVVGGSVAYNDPAFAFRVTSDSLGVNSNASINVGTGGGTDLFGALDSADSTTHTFPVGSAGTDGTVYTATVSINGGEGQVVSIPGHEAQTYSLLLSELEVDAGVGAEWSLPGNVRCTSDLEGAASSVLITDGTLFAALSDFVEILAAVPGTDGIGVVGTGAAPIITFPLVGAQTLTATATDGFGATGDDTAAVTVNPV